MKSYERKKIQISKVETEVGRDMRGHNPNFLKYVLANFYR